MANVSASVLTDIKKLLGLDEGYSAFNVDIMIHINSAFSTLQQLGVGPEKGFMIYSDATTWSTFLTAEDFYLNQVKTYVYLRVRLLFDPPGTAYLVNAINDQIKEMEWRLNVAAESRLILPPVIVDPPIIVFPPADDTLSVKGRLRAEWTAVNPILRLGEPGMEIETGRIKLGDGVTPWVGLSFYEAALPDVEEFEFIQNTPSAIWLIDHQFGRSPLVDVYVGGEQVEADVTVTNTRVTITFPAPTAGTAVLS